MSTQIQRHQTPHGIEVRSTKSGGHKLVGYAAKFGVRTKLPGFTEQIAPGAFTKVLADRNLDCRFLAQHEAGAIFGRTTAGTLRLSQDSTGLYYECDLPDTRSADELWTAVQRGDITQSSFGFLVGHDGCTWEEERGPDGPIVLRTITEIDKLLDCSAVTYPAYHDATCEARGKHAMPAHVRKQFESVIELRRQGSQRLLGSSPLAQRHGAAAFIWRPKSVVDHSADIVRRRSALLNVILSS